MLSNTSQDLSTFAIDSIKLPVAILSRDDLKIRFANHAFRKEYDLHSTEFMSLPITKLEAKPVDTSVVNTTTIAELMESTCQFPEIECEANFIGRQRGNVCINMRAIELNSERMLLLTIEDVTNRREWERVANHRHKRLQKNVNTAKQVLQSEIIGRERVEAALQESQSALLQSREELRNLSASLLNAQDAERRRVSRELHDDLSQKVAKLQFDAETLEQQVPFEDIQTAKIRLRNVGQQAAAVSEDLRRVAHQLHPATLDHLGLTIAVRSYTEEFTRSTAIHVKFTSIYVPRDIPVEVSGGFFRIVQEALRNVAKHASDADVEIVLAGVPYGIAMFIRDNGEGFNIEAARATGGLGLVSMQERVRLLDGTLSLETTPGKGVLLIIQCPLPVRKA